MKRKIFLVAVIILIFVGGFLWVDICDKQNVVVKEPAKVTSPVEKKVETPAPVKIEKKNYREIAKKGDGVTHLARRAISKYLKDKNLSNLTNEQKVFAEDFLVKKLVNKYKEVVLITGSIIDFDGASIDDAISLSLKVDTKNLVKFSKKVDWKKYSGV